MEFEFLSAEKIKPKGWYLRQLQTQANGLNGNLDKVWKDVYDSKWLGGNSEGWERLPYFLDGYIPLAYLLDDEDRKARAKKYIDALLSCQAENGCFYPKGDEGKAGDIWSQFLILKVLTVYADCSKDDRIEESVYRGLRFLRNYTRWNPPFEWAASRWYECIIPMLWIMKRRKNEDWLIRFATRLKTYGVDFETAIELWEDPSVEWSHEMHVVNIGMALKSDALYSEITGKPRKGLAEKMLDKLTEKHGTAYDHFTGDECLSGTSPSQGSELCGVVDTMYSYEWLTALTGEAKWGDRLETLAFNALPAAISTDMWTHQYDQQVNQIACVRFEKQPFTTNNNDANLFGLEPHFGCCTSNFGQGFPKFILSAYMKKAEELIVVSPIPAEIQFETDNKVVVNSEYPFRNAFGIYTQKDTKIRLRLPKWATVECTENYEIQDGWIFFVAQAGKEVRIAFKAEPRLEKRPDNRYCLKYGALLFALPVKSEMTMYEYVKDGVERKFPYCDYEITPVGEWKYAFTNAKFEVKEQSYDLPFDREKPPVVIQTRLVPVEWEYAQDMPLVASPKAGTKKIGEEKTLCLQPYGATYLRMTEMALAK